MEKIKRYIYNKIEGVKNHTEQAVNEINIKNNKQFPIYIVQTEKLDDFIDDSILLYFKVNNILNNPFGATFDMARVVLSKELLNSL